MQIIFPAQHEISGRTPRRLNSRTASRAHKKLTGQIHTDHFVPLRQGHLIERRVRLEAGVVDQDVHGAKLVAHGLEHCSDLRFT